MSCICSLDLRQRALILRQEGKSVSRIAQMLKISRQSIYNWIRLEAEHKLKPAIPTYRNNYKIDENRAMSLLSTQKDLTLQEMSEQLGVNLSTVWRFLIKNKISRKNNNPLY